MLMKNGEEVPGAFADALNDDAYTAVVFAKMRPSCQQEYVLRASKAKCDDAGQSCLQSILSEIRKYGQRHKIAAPENNRVV